MYRLVRVKRVGLRNIGCNVSARKVVAAICPQSWRDGEKRVSERAAVNWSEGHERPQPQHLSQVIPGPGRRPLSVAPVRGGTALFPVVCRFEHLRSLRGIRRTDGLRCERCQRCQRCRSLVSRFASSLPQDQRPQSRGVVSPGGGRLAQPF